MLVLTRKQNEEIQIGDDIRVTVLRIKGNSVRLGIQAPSHVRVVRGELPPQPKVQEITVMVTDPETGEIHQAWNSVSETSAEVAAEPDDKTPQRDRVVSPAAWQAAAEIERTTRLAAMDRRRTRDDRGSREPGSGSEPGASGTRREVNRLQEIVGQMHRPSSVRPAIR